MNTDDVVMAKLAALLYFPFQIQEANRIISHIAGQYLDGNVFLELGVLCQPDLTHGTPAQFLNQLITSRTYLDSRR